MATPRTKIVATVGPACRQQKQLLELIRLGVDVFRVNMAHGSRAEHQKVVDDIHSASREAGRPIGILVDLAGPKIRLGELATDPMNCETGGEVTFVRGEKAQRPGELVSTYPRLVDELRDGDCVMLADGLVSLEVTSRQNDSVRCRVVAGGIIRNRQGINLPGVKLSLPALTDDDLDNALWAAKAGIDFVGLSFVRSPNEVIELKELLRGHGSPALAIAKIEKREALDRLEEVVQAADGVMVARGDLGVEIDVAEIAVAQKRIIATCRQLVRPVIVATQMLDSMHHSPRPTRAEATDVANAILDGADACMMSGETAIGEYPRESVTMMQRIMVATERLLADRPAEPPPATALAGVHPITSAVVYGAARIAAQLFARLVVVATCSGATALVKAKQRDFVPTLGLSQSEETLRRMCLFWGITPLYGAPVSSPTELQRFVLAWGREQKMLRAGDRVVYVTGTGVLTGAHNQIVVHEVE